MSLLPQLEPNDQAGSYSTLSILTLKGPSLTSTSFLQATGQAWQVGFFDQDMVVDIFAGDLFGVVLAKGRQLRVVGWAARRCSR